MLAITIVPHSVQKHFNTDFIIIIIVRLSRKKIEESLEVARARSEHAFLINIIDPNPSNTYVRLKQLLKCIDVILG